MTKREQQVIELLCQGLANKAIARRLGISAVSYTHLRAHET